ncbi:MAG: 3-hydroxyisobutyrate dehydrogenase [Desulfuromonadaceae bacterium GWC2_58_13]|nr:MAG: 3-hydroxyisobutyrate dehydrogenase [Desulfuromonadaceae bacterium GWC2_58_13]
MVKDIGFIGLGTVGRHIAANLLKAHYKLSVYDSKPEPAKDLLTQGAKWASSPFEVAQGKDMVIVVMPEKEEMEAALSGTNGFMAGLSPGAILVDMGTHSLEATMELSAMAVAKGVQFLEAPIWGTKEHAISGLLTVLTGGDQTLLSRCREVFSHFALNIIHVGEVGDATRMKFVVNLVQAELMEALAEGLVLGDRLGFKADKILEVLESGGVSSPLFNAKGRSVARGDFSRNLALKYVYEGLLMAKEVAAQDNLELPAANAVAKVFEKAVKAGRGEEDFSAIFKELR